MKSMTKCQAMLNGWLVREQARNMKEVFMLLQSRIRTRRQGRGDRQVFLSMRKARSKFSLKNKFDELVFAPALNKK